VRRLVLFVRNGLLPEDLAVGPIDAQHAALFAAVELTRQKQMIVPDSQRRVARFGQIDFPGHVFRGGPLLGQVSFLAQARPLRSAPLRPVARQRHGVDQQPPTQKRTGKAKHQIILRELLWGGFLRRHAADGAGIVIGGGTGLQIIKQSVAHETQTSICDSNRETDRAPIAELFQPTPVQCCNQSPVHKNNPLFLV
jgi:hypothetical protein